MTCEVCEKQPRGRKAEPLPCMKLDENRPAVGGRVYGRGTDDSFYICTECGAKWMREEGRDGYGWS